jgi:hypothetical protein
VVLAAISVSILPGPANNRRTAMFVAAVIMLVIAMVLFTVVWRANLGSEGFFGVWKQHWSYAKL